MATTIDDLVVTLNLDAKNFLKSQKEILSALDKLRKANEDNTKKIAASAKRQGEAFALVTRQAMSFFAALMMARSVKDFAVTMTAANTELVRFGRSLGESPQRIGALSNVAARLGGSMQSTASTINNISKALYDLHTNGKALPTEFYRLMAMTNTKIDTNRGPVKFLTDAAVALQRLAKIDPSTARFIAQGMGIDDATAAAMIRYGAAFKTIMDAEAKRHAWAPAALKASEELSESWVKMTQNARDLGGLLYERLSPAIVDISKNMDAWIAQNQDWISSNIIDAAQKFLSIIDQIPVAFQKMKDVASDLEVVMKPITNLLNSLNRAPSRVMSSRDQTKDGEWYSGGPGNMMNIQRGSLADWVAGKISGRRALGGSTLGGRSYLVGEHGPELFTPGVNGAVSNRFGGAELRVMGREVSRGNPVPVILQGIGSNAPLSFGSMPGGGAGGNGAGGGSGVSFGGGSSPNIDVSPVGKGRSTKHMTSAMAKGIAESALALGIKKEDLATAISYETGGTFDPTKTGPRTKWGRHRGLIQWGEPQARKYGVDWNNPIESQLGGNGAVVRYLRDAGVKPGMGLLDIYSAINAGRVGLYHRSDAAAGGAWGTVADKVKYQMGSHKANALRLFGQNETASLPRKSNIWSGNKSIGSIPSGSPQLASGVSNSVANDNRRSISASIGKIDINAPGGDPKDIAYRVGGELRGVLPILAEGGLK